MAVVVNLDKLLVEKKMTSRALAAFVGITEQNLSLLKKMVLNLIRLDTTDKVKTSMRQKRKRAAWDDDIRMAMLGIKPL